MQATGTEQRLQSLFPNFEAFEKQAKQNRLHQRLGFRSAANAWVTNPVVTIPIQSESDSFHWNRCVR